MKYVFEVKTHYGRGMQDKYTFFEFSLDKDNGYHRTARLDYGKESEQKEIALKVFLQVMSESGEDPLDYINDWFGLVM